MKRQFSRNKFIMYYHEVTELPYSYCRSILKEHHWNLNNFTNYEIQMIRTIFAKYRVDVVDSYVEDIYIGVHLYTFKIKTKAVTEAKRLTLRKRFAHLLPSHRIGCSVTSCCSDSIFNFFRVLPDKPASHLNRVDIEKFINEVMYLVQYNFFCLNDLKYKCQFAGYLWNDHNLHIRIVDSDSNMYNAILPVKDIYEFRKNTKRYVYRIAYDVIRCFQETYDFIKWASN